MYPTNYKLVIKNKYIKIFENRLITYNLRSLSPPLLPPLSPFLLKLGPLESKDLATPWTKAPLGPVHLVARIRPVWSKDAVNSTASPSRKLRNPGANITDWCTNTSAEPSDGVKKPNPLVLSNHLTVPVLIAASAAAASAKIIN